MRKFLLAAAFAVVSVSASAQAPFSGTVQSWTTPLRPTQAPQFAAGWNTTLQALDFNIGYPAAPNWIQLVPSTGGSIPVTIAGPLTVGSPQIYNPGQTATPGGIVSAVPSTYGAFSPAVGESLIVNCPTCLPEVAGFTTPSAVATDGNRGSVSLFASNTTRAPYLTLNNPTYDTTHVYPATDLTPTQVAGVRIGAFIETNDSPKYTGTITAVAANGSSITVSGWFQSGNTGSGQVPAGTAAYVDVVNLVFNFNGNVNISNNYPNLIGGVGMEEDIDNGYGSFTEGKPTNPNSDVPNAVGYQAVCASTTDCGAAFNVSGNFTRGYLVQSPAGPAFIAGMTSGDLLVAQAENSTAAYSFEARAEGILNLGLQSGTGGGFPAINFFHSGNGVSDVEVYAAGGGATAYNGILRTFDLYTAFYSPSGTSGDAVYITAQTTGLGGILSVSSTANAPLLLESAGTGSVGILGYPSHEAFVAYFVPPAVTGANQTNYLNFTASLTGSPFVVSEAGVDTNQGLTIKQSGTGTLTLGDTTGTVAFPSHISSTGTIPALSSCGTSPTITTGSTDTKGAVTEGTTATGCTITFATAYATAPMCVVSSPDGILPTSYSASTTALTITNASASGDEFDYQCMQ